MFVAVALSIAATLQRMSSPTIATLGKLGESRNFVDVSYMPGARTDPQIIVLRPSQPLFFANAEATLSRIVDLVASNAARVAILSLEDSDTLDSTALDALVECEQRLAHAGCTLILARVKEDMLEALRRTGPGAFRCILDAISAWPTLLTARSEYNRTKSRLGLLDEDERSLGLDRLAEQDLVDAHAASAHRALLLDAHFIPAAPLALQAPYRRSPGRCSAP